MRTSDAPNSERIPELKGDPSRQATSLFKGIDYQIWQTVAEWIDLREEEILIVEGAEDFDKLAESSATINQVKNLTSPISLRTDCICDALRNFWLARYKNPKRNILFRLITTAAFRVEANAPFGKGQSGLSLWNEEASSATTQYSERLKEFLLSDESIAKRLAEAFTDDTPSLVGHLRNLTPEAFRSEFVCRVQWLKQQPDIEVLRETVRVKLHAYGESQHILPHDSERALTPLFDHVAHTAIRERRHLTRADFRVLFDDSTRISLPISQFNQMQTAISLLPSHLSQSTHLTFEVADITSIPDLPIPCAPRTDSVDALAKCMGEHKFVAIQGSTGKGKSTLAKLLARKLGGSWSWVNFAGREAQHVYDELYRLSHHAAGQLVAPSLLIDDFNPKGSEFPRLLQKLSVLSRLTLARGGRMIVTTQRVLGEAFLRQSDLSKKTLQHVTAFHEHEVQELCTNSGCPQDHRLISWVKIVSTQTGGHPQLVHARIKVASRNGWPAPSISDVLETPQEIVNERQLARQLLQELDDSEVELLYRLSIGSQPFRRDQVLTVAEISPPINRAGEKFDGLVDPWIEPAGKTYFRLSNLLSRAAEENWTPDRVRGMRIEYAKAIYNASDCTLLEISELLFQAVLTKEDTLAGMILPSLVLAPLKSRKAVAQWLDWILVLPAPSAIFTNNPCVCYLFSLVQFRVAVASQSDSASKFAERLFIESNKSIGPEIDNISSFGAATDIIIAIQIAVPPLVLLQAWLSVRKGIRGDKRLEKVARSYEKMRPRHGRVIRQQSFDQMLFDFILVRRGGGDYFRQFVSAVDSLSDEDRVQVISALRANYFGLVGFVDDVWMHELGKDNADWNESISVLEGARFAGERWGLPELSGIAARGIATVLDEYLQKPDEALQVLEETAVKFGDSLMVRYQRGTVQFLAKRYFLAYESWFSTLKEWPSDDEIAAQYGFNAFSNCGAAAGLLEKWDDSMSAFERGQTLAVKVHRKLEALKFGMDAAYAQWRAGQKRQALCKFAKCLSEMEKLCKTEKSAEFHTIWKLIEHFAVWFKIDAGAPHDLKIFTPRPGICSEAKSKEKHELVKDSARQPALVSWYCLAESELYADLGSEIFSQISVRKDLHSDPNLHPLFQFLTARRALADRKFGSVPVYAELSFLAFSEIKTTAGPNGTLFPQATSTPLIATGAPSFVEESLLCALLVASAEDLSWDDLIRQWRSNADRMKSPAILKAAIETIERICGLMPMEVFRNYARGAPSRFAQGVGDHLSPNTRINRLCVLRRFCRYLSHFDADTCIVHQSFSPRRTRPAPHIYTRQDIRRIMAAARQLGPPGSLRPVVVANLIGLLYATGVRIGEALNLTLRDIDLRRRLMEVREGKFRKSRYVPLSPSAARQLKKYLRQRSNAAFSTIPTAPVFLNITGTRHGHPGFVTLYLELLRSLGLRGPKGQPGPRIHDLRHTFAVHRLLAWYRQGANLAAKLPLLSTYLGHSTITGTEIYLQATAQLLECAGRRFRAHFAIPLTKHHDKA